MMRIITSPTLLEDLSQLDPLLATEGWNTLMTFTRETGCMFFFAFSCYFSLV
jgi:nuclear protein localization family protein 4